MYFFKRSPQKPEGPLAFKSDEHKMSLGSIVLIIVMVGFLLVVSERALFDLEDSIARPDVKYPYGCLYDLEYYDSYYDYNQPQPYTQDGHIEPKVDKKPVELQGICNQIRTLQKEYRAKRLELEPLNRKRSGLENSLNLVRGQYDTSLFEKIADEANVGGSASAVRTDVQKFEKELADVNKQITEFENDTLKPLANQIRELQKTAKSAASWDKRLYETKVFGLQALFVIPFFLFGFFWYRRSQEKYSKWSFIPLGILIVSSITALQIFGRFVWSWLPREFFRRIWDILSQHPLTRIVGYYIIIILIIAVFAGLIYVLQKKLFSFKRMARKRLAARGCPYCAFPLHAGKTYCSGCGNRILNECASCGKKTYKFMMYCEECGKEQG